jgi:uncharacterized Zn-finger protein
MIDNNRLYDYKISWIPTQIMEFICQHRYTDDVLCPYCDKTSYQVFSNGDVFDIASERCEIKCPHCDKMFYLAWEWDWL